VSKIDEISIAIAREQHNKIKTAVKRVNWPRPGAAYQRCDFWIVIAAAVG
jgi:hypothetical protein